MAQEQFSIQTVVIGAGVVGLAIGRALARSGREVLVLEAGTAIGEGISSRNSEVIHAGIYYPEVPTPLPRVPINTGTSSWHNPASSTLPRPCGPRTPMPWASSTTRSAS